MNAGILTTVLMTLNVSIITVRVLLEHALVSISIYRPILSNCGDVKTSSIGPTELGYRQWGGTSSQNITIDNKPWVARPGRTHKTYQVSIIYVKEEIVILLKLTTSEHDIDFLLFAL